MRWIFRQGNETPADYFYHRNAGSSGPTFECLFCPPDGMPDPDVATSRSLLENGAIFGLLALIAVAAAAWIYRKRFPLAALGVAVFLLLIAPTSSIVPIQDVQFERRVYLPFLGLALIVLEFLRRLKFSQIVGVGAAILAICTLLTYQRSEVWASSFSLWQDTVAKSPRKVRPRFQLAYAKYESGHCPDASADYEIASTLGPPDYTLLTDWALALDCTGHEDGERFRNWSRPPSWKTTPTHTAKWAWCTANKENMTRHSRLWPRRSASIPTFR